MNLTPEMYECGYRRCGTDCWGHCGWCAAEAEREQAGVLTLIDIQPGSVLTVPAFQSPLTYAKYVTLPTFYSLEHDGSNFVVSEWNNHTSCYVELHRLDYNQL